MRPTACATVVRTGPDVAADPRWSEAVRLARLGGRLALDGLRDAQVSFKADDSMLTDVDARIQEHLTAEIASTFPDDAVVGEEGGSSLDTTKARVWVVDPIDGTNNFARGLPGFAVSVGVLVDGVPAIGAVYDPVADQLFTACAGGGAWRNTERLAVRGSAPSRRSLISVRTPFAGAVPRPVLTWLTRYRLRRTGSTALHLCYVASGALAFVHDHRASVWDIAGAAPVLLEAGGRLTTTTGRPLFPVGADVLDGAAIAFLAGDPVAHDHALADLRAGASPTAEGGSSC